RRPRPVPAATESSCFPSWCCSWLCRFVHAGVRVEEYQRARPAASAGLDPLEGRTFNRGGGFKTRTRDGQCRNDKAPTGVRALCWSSEDDRIGRSDWNRTSDLLVPNETRYQAALRSVLVRRHFT